MFGKKKTWNKRQEDTITSCEGTWGGKKVQRRKQSFATSKREVLCGYANCMGHTSSVKMVLLKAGRKSEREKGGGTRVTGQDRLGQNLQKRKNTGGSKRKPEGGGKRKRKKSLERGALKGCRGGKNGKKEAKRKGGEVDQDVEPRRV